MPVTITQKEDVEQFEVERQRLAKRYGLDAKSISADYIAERIEYEELTGSIRKRLQNSIRLNFLQAVAIIPLVGAVLYLATQKTHVVPFVVAEHNGRVTGIGAAVRGPDDLTEATRQQLLREWIENARSVLSDWEAQKVLIEKVMRQTSGAGNRFMTNWYTDQRPDKRAKNEHVTVHIANVLPVSRQTYEVEWVEDTFNADGEQTSTARWKGWFRTNIDPARDLTAAAQNPVGFAVTEISWSKIQ
jgi:type IV secretory pathway TrbF-like protein